MLTLGLKDGEMKVKGGKRKNVVSFKMKQQALILFAAAFHLVPALTIYFKITIPVERLIVKYENK
jgi:hypothetical protein